MKLSSLCLLSKIVYLTSQVCHFLVVHPLLRKILDLVVEMLNVEMFVRGDVECSIFQANDKNINNDKIK